MSDKAYDRYSILARWGLPHRCSQALVELKKKQSASGFECLASLHRVVDRDMEKHEAEMVDRLLGTDTPDRRYYKNSFGV